MLKPILLAALLLHASALPAPWHRSFWKPIIGLSCIFLCASDSLKVCLEKFPSQRFRRGESVGSGAQNTVLKVSGTDFVYKKSLEVGSTQDEENLYNFNRMSEIYGINKPVCYSKRGNGSLAFLYHEVIPLDKLPKELTLPYFENNAIQRAFTALRAWLVQREGLDVYDVSTSRVKHCQHTVEQCTGTENDFWAQPGKLCTCGGCAEYFMGLNMGISFAGEPILYDLDSATWDERWKFDAGKEAYAARRLNAALRSADWREFLEKVQTYKGLKKWEKSGRFKKFNLY